MSAVAPRLTILLGDPTLPDATKRTGRFEAEDLDCIERMRTALAAQSRWTPQLLQNHSGLLEQLREERPAFVLNFCDTGYRNQATRELHVAALLDLLEIPYSGATPAAMATCYDKGLVTATARAIGIPTPRERYFARPADAMGARLPLPALIKPTHGDGSVGITQRAVVHTQKEARAYLAWLAETLPGRSVLVQEYLPGPEYSVGLIGNPDAGLHALPLLEVDFSALPAAAPPILCFESKTDPDSPYWTDIRFRPARLAPLAAESLADYSRRLFDRLGLRDYGRFDFRTDARGTVRLMEVNPNPAWGYDGKLALMAGLAGESYADLLSRIVDTALNRVHTKAAQPPR